MSEKDHSGCYTFLTQGGRNLRKRLSLDLLLKFRNFQRKVFSWKKDDLALISTPSTSIIKFSDRPSTISKKKDFKEISGEEKDF